MFGVGGFRSRFYEVRLLEEIVLYDLASQAAPTIADPDMLKFGSKSEPRREAVASFSHNMLAFAELANDFAAFARPLLPGILV